MDIVGREKEIMNMREIKLVLCDLVNNAHFLLKLIFGFSRINSKSSNFISKIFESFQKIMLIKKIPDILHIPHHNSSSKNAHYMHEKSTRDKKLIVYMQTCHKQIATNN